MALGFQVFGALVTLIGYWIIAVPVSAVLVFGYGYGIAALWVGPLIASVFLTTCYVIKLSTISLDEIIKDAQVRSEIEKQEYLKSLERQQKE